MEKGEKVSSKDLAGVYQEIAEQIGVKETRILYDHFKGQQLSLPIKFYNNDYIGTRIKGEYHSGKTIKEIARNYGYTERRVRQIIKYNE